MLPKPIFPAMFFRSVAAAVAAFAVASAHASGIEVSITDARGRPVPDAVIVASASGVTEAFAPATATVDQVAKAFVPSVLVVRTGTSVTFPNSDTVAHQVYSFSPAKRFELGLYRGRPHPPLLLDRPGLIVLGCNIHDNMVGYIYVTDSPHFGKSDEKGWLTMSGLPAAAYDIVVWSPRLPRESQQHVLVGEGLTARVHFSLPETLRPDTTGPRDPRIKDY